MLNNLPQIHLKLRQKEQLKKTADATGDLIGNKIANKIKVSIRSLQKKSETVESETRLDSEILRGRYIYIYISTEKRQKIIDNLRLI